MFGFFKRRRRKRLLAAPFPAAWLEIIEQERPALRLPARRRSTGASGPRPDLPRREVVRGLRRPRADR